MNARWSDLSELGLPMRLAGHVRLNSGKHAPGAVIRTEILSRDLEREFAGLTGCTASNFLLSTRVFDLRLEPDDQVLVRTEGAGLPLIIRRNGEVIVNFDIQATQAFSFSDSKRPIYTYVPGFNVHTVPEKIRRPLSNFVQSLRAPHHVDGSRDYRRLPLTGFEFSVLLVNSVLAAGAPGTGRAFHWPFGKRAVFVALHDVDTGGFLARRERDPLFRVEAKHQIHSTWFVPTSILNRTRDGVDFLLESAHQVGWHGHKHDHRDHVKPFADEAVRALTKSRLADAANFPTGMRLPKLLKSNYLFDLIDRSCPALCYDTSFLRGIVPHRLWLNGRESRILEIPTTVPTDILLYNELHGVSRTRRAKAMLEAQIARTEQLITAGALISIVTHPETTLSERPDFLDVYDQVPVLHPRQVRHLDYHGGGALQLLDQRTASSARDTTMIKVERENGAVEPALTYPGLSSQPDSGGSRSLLARRLKRFLRTQFGKPHGMLGHVVGGLMARSPSNLERIRWTLSLLDVQPHERILEIGIGPGVAVEYVSRCVSEGCVVGIDHSEVMVRQAEKRNARGLRDGRVELRLGSVASLPAFSEPFDKIFTINSIHFWHEPVECLAKLRAAMRPGGLIAVTIQPRSRSATDATTKLIGAEVTENLVRAGFSRCRLEIRRTSPVSTACALGVA